MIEYRAIPRDNPGLPRGGWSTSRTAVEAWALVMTKRHAADYVVQTRQRRGSLKK